MSGGGLVPVRCGSCGSDGLVRVDGAEEAAALAGLQAAGAVRCPECEAGLNDRRPGCGVPGCECESVLVRSMVEAFGAESAAGIDRATAVLLAIWAAAGLYSGGVSMSN